MIMLSMPSTVHTTPDRGAEIKSAALALLTRREHSRQELLDKLSRKFSSEAEIERQLDALEQSGLLSEERFTESFVRARQAAGKGPKLIKQELKRRGVSAFLIESYVTESDHCWLDIAHRVYTKKFSDIEVADQREKARRIRFMVSRGFSPETIFPLLDARGDADFL